MDSEVGLVMMKWVYTDKAEIPYDENFLIRLVKAANKYRLKALRERYDIMLGRDDGLQILGDDVDDNTCR